jgi:exodeoxyribonuclease VII large subunit
MVDIFAEKRILTVSQLSSLIRGVLEENFDHVWVSGEVSNLSMPASGHLYFTLKDVGAQLRCVMFRASARILRLRPKDGGRLIVRGRISLFEPRGEYQLIVEYLEPQGIGALQTAFLELKEKLAAEGLFDECRKKPLPRFPSKIGVITSATGAAIHDILNVLDRRFGNLEILINPVRVQGDGAAVEIAQAIKEFNRYKHIDVMILARGGGSLEDLWAFNEEIVARAIYSSRIPVISAVGHETDYTIADFVASLRAPTPSAAAEIVIKSKDEHEEGLKALTRRLEQAIMHNLAGLNGEIRSLIRSLKDPVMLLGSLTQRTDYLNDRLAGAVEKTISKREHRISYILNHLRLVSPGIYLERARELLVSISDRADLAIQRKIDQKRQLSAVNTGKLDSLSPLHTLARGYAVVRRLPENSVVREAGELNIGDQLDITLLRGGALCRVDKIR